ncbi:MAG: RNA polymerase-binding protein DksA [Candidatus Competibacter sp.]|nr:RNA polymerase-binding protein DksA [Candidatus Competibacter sp.]
MAATHPLAQETPASYQAAEGEPYMSETQLAHFRKVLTEWKESLLHEVDRTVNHMQDESATFPDPNDRATQEEEFSLELRTRDRERKLIKKINEAIGLIESGDYGYCEACGVEIGLPRMLARPTATLCIDCKMLEEIREKQGN